MKRFYGKDHMYVLDETIRADISNLTGHSTLHEGDKERLVNLGLTFEKVDN